MNRRVFEYLEDQRRGALARIRDDLDTLERLTELVYESGDGTQVESWREWLGFGLDRLVRRLVVVRGLVAQGPRNGQPDDGALLPPSRRTNGRRSGGDRPR